MHPESGSDKSSVASVEKSATSNTHAQRPRVGRPADRRRQNDGSARAWALAYAALGWRVFPVVAGEKRPIYPGWQRDATIDHSLIAQYWRREPGPNIGLICGEAFVAFDIEADHLPAFRNWMRAEGHRLPVTPVARTGRGGIHILAQGHALAQGHTLTHGHDLRLGGVHIGELKATGGFIVACPSHTTRSYGWLRSPTDVALAAAPEWLAGLVVDVPANAVRRPVGAVSPSRAVALLTGLYRVVAGAAEGERNKVLFWASCRAAEHGVDVDAAAEILLAAAREAGLSEREARSTIASLFQR